MWLIILMLFCWASTTSLELYKMYKRKERILSSLKELEPKFVQYSSKSIEEIGLFVVEICINGVEVKMLVDTGATHTVLDGRVAETIYGKDTISKLKGENKTFTILNTVGDKKAVDACIQSNISFLGKNGVANVQIANMHKIISGINSRLPKDLCISGILGADILSAIQANIDYKSRQIQTK